MFRFFFWVIHPPSNSPYMQAKLFHVKFHENVRSSEIYFYYPITFWGFCFWQNPQKYFYFSNLTLIFSNHLDSLNIFDFVFWYFRFLWDLSGLTGVFLSVLHIRLAKTSRKKKADTKLIFFTDPTWIITNYWWKTFFLFRFINLFNLFLKVVDAILTKFTLFSWKKRKHMLYNSIRQLHL